MTVLAKAVVVLEGDAAQLYSVFASAESAMRQAGARMESIGRDLSTKITLPLVGAGTAAVSTAADFDQSMRKIVALTGVSQTQVDAWRGQVRDLAIQFGSTGNKAAEALYFITSAGVEGSKAMDALRVSLIGSAIGLGDAQVVADAVTSAMNAYTKSGLTAVQATEQLAAAVKYGKFEASELAPEIGNLTGMASALHISFASVVGTLAVFSRTGTSAAEGATQLSSIMNTLLGTNAASVKMLEKQGLSLAQLRQVAGDGPRGLVNVMRLLNTAFDGQVDKLSVIIPNIRAFRGVMNALAQDTGDVNAVLDGTANSTGFLDSALAAMQGPALQLKKIWAQLKDALISAGTALLPVVIPLFQELVGWVQRTATAFENMRPETKRLIVEVLGVGAAIGPVLLAFGGFVKVLSFLKISSVITGIVSLTGALGGLLSALSISTVLFNVRAAFSAAELAGTGLRGVMIGLTPAIKGAGMALFGLIPGIKGSMLLFNVQAAFAAAAEAGTGLTGVLIGLAPTLKATFAALAPFLATAVVIGGLAAIAYEYVTMKHAVADVTTALREQKKAMDEATASTAPDIAKQRIKNIDEAISRLTLKVNGYLTAAREASSKTTFAADATHVNIYAEALRKGKITQEQYDAATKKTTASSGQSAEQLMESATALQDTISALQHQRDILMEVVKAYTVTTPAVAGTTGAVGTQAKWAETAADAMQKLHDQLQQTKDMQALFGKQFDVNEADAKAYQDAINTLVAAHVPLDTIIGDTGESLRTLVQHLNTAQGKVDAAKDSQDAFNQAISNAQSAVQAALTPQQIYEQTVRDLKTALAAGKITQDGYNAAVLKAHNAMESATGKANEFGRAIKDQVGRASDELVDFAFGAQQSFGQFVKSALEDLAKLIVRLEVMKLLFPTDASGAATGGLGKLLGFAKGGFLPGGQVGMVGENGPELVMAGRQGVTVTPLPAMSTPGMSGGADFGGGVVHAQVNVMATDSRDVERFFKENEGLVATTFIRAYQKSSALRRLMGGV